jgi:hypothetical protein
MRRYENFKERMWRRLMDKANMRVRFLDIHNINCGLIKVVGVHDVCIRCEPYILSFVPAEQCYIVGLDSWRYPECIYSYEKYDTLSSLLESCLQPDIVLYTLRSRLSMKL